MTGHFFRLFDITIQKLWPIDYVAYRPYRLGLHSVIFYSIHHMHAISSFLSILHLLLSSITRSVMPYTTNLRELKVSKSKIRYQRRLFFQRVPKQEDIKLVAINLGQFSADWKRTRRVNVYKVVITDFTTQCRTTSNNLKQTMWLRTWKCGQTDR